MTPGECGYTLGNSYAVGNGGTLWPKIHPAKSNDLNQPDETISLGEVDVGFVPADAPEGEQWVTLELKNNLSPVTAGETYFVVIHNTKPPQYTDNSDAPINNLTAAQARLVKTDTGAQGLNGIIFRPDVATGIGPFYTSEFMTYKRDATSGDFSSAVDLGGTTLGWWEVGYDDWTTDIISQGTWYGVTHGCWDCTKTDATNDVLPSNGGSQLIEGSVYARQRFTVRDATRYVTGVWIAFSHDQWTAASGEPLDVQLKVGDTVLETVEIAYDSATSAEAIANSEQGISAFPRKWGYAAFSQTRTLTENTEYTLVLSSDAGAGFVLSANPYKTNIRNQPAVGDGWSHRNRAEWEDSKAELSTDSGSTWGDYFSGGGAPYTERDLPVLFTIEGMPTELVTN